jgi:hypothetical protein
MSVTVDYTQPCQSTCESQDRRLELRWAILAALRKIGQPAPSSEIVRHIGIDATPQAITMAASREPRYFKLDTTGKQSKRGTSHPTLISIHPHLVR